MSVSQETLERIKCQLREASSMNGGESQDLYNHLTEVFNRVIVHHSGSTDAYEKFEEISALVKKTKLQFADPKLDIAVNAPKKINAAALRYNDHTKQRKNLLNGVAEKVTKDDKQLIQTSQVFCLPNFVEEAEMLDWAGINFGTIDTYALQHSIKRLAQMSGGDKIRFCGKIYGKEKDYWIVSGELSAEHELQQDPTVEPRGFGVNALVFWVTDNLLHDWIQLPDCRPEHIADARLVKRVMTGNLNANVVTNPPFRGKERHFLRAQLARIFHASALSPKGLYEMIDSEVENQPAERRFSEEFAMPTADELKILEGWGNTHPIILGTGRTTHVSEPGMDEEAAAEYKERMETSDPTVERFRGINEHKGMPGTMTDPENPESEGIAFLSKIVGDQQNYAKPSGEGSVSYCVNVIKSLRWPGAVSVAKGGKFVNVYVGHGLKRGDTSFSPTEPPEVLKDPVDQPERPEPTPLEAPEEPVEDDTDKEVLDDEDQD